MKIKDVEKLTGLSAKSIRLYEEKGLLKVERNGENEYRAFTEENVEQLRLIRLLRYLDFSISEIGALMDAGDERVKEALCQKLAGYDGERERLEQKEQVCRALLKDFSRERAGEVAEEYLRLVELFDDAEYRQMERDLKDSAHPSIGMLILTTLLYAGPILNLWMVYVDQNWERLKLAIPLSLLGTVLLTLSWRHYIVTWWKHRDYQRERNKGSVWLLPGIVLAIAACIGIFVLVEQAQRALFCPEGWLFFDIGRFGGLVLIIITELPLIYLLLSGLYRLTKNVEFETANWLAQKVRRYWPAALAVWAVLFYAAFVNITVVTGDQIIRHDILHPAGVAYGYEDVTAIEAGYRMDGDFYYKICLDGKWSAFSAPSVNEALRPDYEEDSYLELEEFDQALMAYGPEKTISTKNESRASYDQVYLDRFRRIIENQ